MARYIDADALGIGKAKREAFEIPEYADGWNSAIEIIANVPTADVVERAEVAREIFEEIKKVIGEQYENYVFDNMEIEGVEQDAIIAFADAMKIHFAELKKKYVGGGSDGER